MTTEGITKYPDAVKLEEVDLLRMHLLNRTLDLLELQVELSKARAREALQDLQKFGNVLMQKYSLLSIDEIDATTGEIHRISTDAQDNADAH